MGSGRMRAAAVQGPWVRSGVRPAAQTRLGSSFGWEPRDQRKGEHVGTARVTPTPPRAAQRDVLSTQNFAAWPHRAAKALGSVVCIQASTQAAGSWGFRVSRGGGQL